MIPRHVEEFRLPERIESRKRSSGSRPSRCEALAALAGRFADRLAALRDDREWRRAHGRERRDLRVVELGWVQRGSLPERSGRRRGHSTGKVSDASVPARGDLHILRVVAWEPAGAPLQEVREGRIYEENRQYEQEMKRYLAEVTARAFCRDTSPPTRSAPP